MSCVRLTLKKKRASKPLEDTIRHLGDTKTQTGSEEAEARTG